VADSPYYIDGTDCLKNELGITDKDELAKAEDDITSARLALLKSNPLPGDISYQYLKEVHDYLFGGIYKWAGKERTFQTQKGTSRFDFPNNIEKNANKHLSQLNAENFLKDLERPEFIERAAHYFAELNAVHPFPEGNGRAQRVIFDKIAKDAGYKFNWNNVGKEQFIEAVVHGHDVDTTKLEAVFDQTLVALDRSTELDKSPAIDFTVTDPVDHPQYTKAIKALEDKASELAQPLREEEKLRIDEMQNNVETLDKQIQEHINSEPKSLLSFGKSADEKQVNWDNDRRVLIAERDHLLEYIDSAKSGKIHKATETSIMKKAERLAENSLPLESKTVSNFEADKTLKQLSERLQELDKSIDQEQQNSDSSKTLPRHLKEKSRILSKLENNKTLNSRLTSLGKKQLSVQSKEVNLTLSRFDTLGKDRGR